MLTGASFNLVTSPDTPRQVAVRSSRLRSPPEPSYAILRSTFRPSRELKASNNLIYSLSTFSDCMNMTSDREKKPFEVKTSHMRCTIRLPLPMTNSQTVSLLSLMCSMIYWHVLSVHTESLIDSALTLTLKKRSEQRCMTLSEIVNSINSLLPHAQYLGNDVDDLSHPTT